MIRRLVLALAVFLSAHAAVAFDLTAMSDAERAAFRAEIRAYLLDNPEVLMEAIGVLDQRQAAAEAMNDRTLAETFADELMNDGYSWVGGNPDGDVTMVEFLDYRCTYCRRAHDEVQALVETDGNIRFIIKEFPILGDQSTLSAQFAVAVQQIYGDDVYFDVHEALMALRADANEDTLTQLAEGFGLDMGQIVPKMTSTEVIQILSRNHQLAQSLQITGTPTFVFNDRMLRGYAPLASMQQLVSDIRAE